jgi:hypothetical protein
MLLKLFKYDFKNTRRYCIPLLIALAAATVIACVTIPTFLTTINIGFGPVSDGAENVLSAIVVLSILGFLAACFIIIVSVSLFQIMVCVEFYRSLVTDEGYLTFTLPVKSSSIIKSKLLNGIAWTFISYGALFISILSIIITAVVSAGIMSEGGGDAGGSTGSVSEPILFEDVLMMITVIIYLIVSLISGLMLYFTAIFFGSVVTKKNKLLAAIGCIFGANFVYGIVSGMSGMGIEFIMLSNAPQMLGTSYTTIFVMGIMIIYSLGMTVLMYYLLKYMMDKKLNLA